MFAEETVWQAVEATADTLNVYTSHGNYKLTGVHKHEFKNGSRATNIVTFSNYKWVHKQSHATITQYNNLPAAYMPYKTLGKHILMPAMGTEIHIRSLKTQTIFDFIHSYLIDGCIGRRVFFQDIKYENVVMNKRIQIIDHESIFCLDDSDMWYLDRPPVSSYSFRWGLQKTTLSVYIENALFGFVLLIIVLAGNHRHWRAVHPFVHSSRQEWKTTNGDQPMTNEQVINLATRLCVYDSEFHVLTLILTAVQQTNISHLSHHLRIYVRLMR